jgi:NAD(P)H-dependent flavin oxidoreductase YrpB (nitropropane dioxygenase family)
MWLEKVGPAQLRSALLEGKLKQNVAWSGAGVGLVSEILGAAEVVQRTVKQADDSLAAL